VHKIGRAAVGRHTEYHCNLLSVEPGEEIFRDLVDGQFRWILSRQGISWGGNRTAFQLARRESLQPRGGWL